MVGRFNNFRTPSRTSPKTRDRGCLCQDNTYRKECCDGSIMAQGIGRIQRIPYYLLLENGGKLLQENNDKIKI